MTQAEVDELETIEEHLVSSRVRLIRMLSLSRKIAVILGSMHWTLVDFRSPVVATCDQPVVLWPRGVAASPPRATPIGMGLFETLEIRVPVSPSHLLLLTWSDGADGAERLVQGQKHHAAAANAFTVANSDRQWMHRPRHNPPIGSGKLLPLASQLLADYDDAAAESSRRRQRAMEIIESMKNEPDLSTEDITVVTVSEGNT